MIRLVKTAEGLWRMALSEDAMVFSKEDLECIKTLTVWAEVLSDFFAKFNFKQPTSDRVKLLQLREKTELALVDLEQAEADKAKADAK